MNLSLISRILCGRATTFARLRLFVRSSALKIMASSNLKIVVRALSTSAANHQLAKPPVQVFGLSGRYATALYSAATKKKELDKVEGELKQVQSAIKTDKKLREFIQNPTIKQSVKVQAINAIASKLSLTPSSGNFLALIAENGRLSDLDAVVTSFGVIMAAHRGEVPCEVTSAKPLDDATKKELEAALKKFTKGNQTILLSTKVDPKIIGGLIVTIGDKYVDMSIASKVKKYTDLISTAA